MFDLCCLPLSDPIEEDSDDSDHSVIDLSVGSPLSNVPSISLSVVGESFATPPSNTQPIASTSGQTSQSTTIDCPQNNQ